MELLWGPSSVRGRDVETLRTARRSPLWRAKALWHMGLFRLVWDISGWPCLCYPFWRQHGMFSLSPTVLVQSGEVSRSLFIGCSLGGCIVSLESSNPVLDRYF